ncbi:hypothetical protein [Persicobacter sp. CCB-QB2]|uniref:hypothetical protein n=1 Tax=Persicobacter sp. CCB-QB2 TaxID=1561025 RepID=UPI0006A9B757|nr:hypothetical protein [Persicobacter sp. CCB-QB2]
MRGDREISTVSALASKIQVKKSNGIITPYHINPSHHCHLFIMLQISTSQHKYKNQHYPKTSFNLPDPAFARGKPALIRQKQKSTFFLFTENYALNFVVFSPLQAPLHIKSNTNQKPAKQANNRKHKHEGLL